MLVPQHANLPAASSSEIAKVSTLRELMRAQAQTHFITQHLVHGGMYVRTVLVPDGQLVAGVRMLVPTVTIVDGHVTIYRENGNMQLTGHHVIPGSAGRMIAFMTHSEVAMDMFYPTKLTDVHEIQKEFTDEHAMLVPLHNLSEHRIIVTGE